MTRGQMTIRLANILAELRGTPQSDSFATLDDNLSNAASELALTYAHYGSESTDLVSGQGEYCAAPSIHRITAVTATWGDGSTQLLRQVNLEQIDDWEQWYLDNWRTNPRSGNPCLYLPLGLNRIKVYPVPDYDTSIYSYADLVIGANTRTVTSAARPFEGTDAIVAPKTRYVLNIAGGTGFNAGQYTVVSVTAGVATLDRSIGDTGSAGGVGTLSQGGITVEGYSTLPGDSWASQNAECPLWGGSMMHDAVIYGAALKRCVEFPVENRERYQMLLGQHASLRNKLSRVAQTQSRAMSNHASGQRNF